MRRQVAAAVCCLAVSVTPMMIAGCSPAEQTEEGVTSGQVVNAQASEPAGKEPIKHAYKDGTYQGEGKGMGGPINVTLTVVDGVVTVDELTETGETPGIGGKEAIEDGTFKALIEEAQSSDIDCVSGATMTTGGVKKAVETALAQAL